MDRQHRRDLKHDRFVDEVGSWTTRARDNQRFLLLITVGVVLVAFIGYGVYLYRSNREQSAQADLAAAIDAIDSPLIQPGTPNPMAKFKDDNERLTRADAMFHDVQKKHAGTDAADVANLYLARIAASHNDIAGARKLLQDFVSSHPKHLLVGAARYSLYQLRIDNGETAPVIAELNQELAKTDGQILPPDTILSLLAHAYETQGNSEQSKEALRKILRQYPDSPYAMEAQRRIGATPT
jgi:TolA-binding protein